jgi:cytochrome c-type biogenesis protein CcmH/NrfG
LYGAGRASILGGMRIRLLSLVLLCTFVMSAVLPALSQSQTSAATAAGGGKTTAAQLEAAAAKADLAAKLDPLAVEPLFVSSAIALGRGRILDARDFLLEAVRRQPDNPDAWSRLAGIAFQLVDRPGFERAATKLLELDPANGTAKALALRAQAFLAPPALSATATGTPLPATTAGPPAAIGPPPPVTVIP